VRGRRRKREDMDDDGDAAFYFRRRRRDVPAVIPTDGPERLSSVSINPPLLFVIVVTTRVTTGTRNRTLLSRAAITFTLLHCQYIRAALVIVSPVELFRANFAVLSVANCPITAHSFLYYKLTRGVFASVPRFQSPSGNPRTLSRYEKQQ